MLSDVENEAFPYFCNGNINEAIESKNNEEDVENEVLQLIVGVIVGSK